MEGSRDGRARRSYDVSEQEVDNHEPDASEGSSAEKNHNPSKTYTGLIPDPTANHVRHTLALTATCKQIKEETAKSFFKNNRFLLKIEFANAYLPGATTDTPRYESLNAAAQRTFEQIFKWKLPISDANYSAIHQVNLSLGFVGLKNYMMCATGAEEFSTALSDIVMAFDVLKSTAMGATWTISIASQFCSVEMCLDDETLESSYPSLDRFGSSMLDYAMSFSIDKGGVGSLRAACKILVREVAEGVLGRLLAIEGAEVTLDPVSGMITDMRLKDD